MQLDTDKLPLLQRGPLVIFGPRKSVVQVGTSLHVPGALECLHVTTRLHRTLQECTRETTETTVMICENSHDAFSGAAKDLC